MLTWLKRSFRRWGTAALVAIYALGILSPAVAFAHANAASVMHVLSEAHGGFLTLHFHNDGPSSDHSNDADHAHHCCGVTSVSGLEPNAYPSLILLPFTTTVAWPSVQRVSDYNLDRLDRPPRDFLPLRR
jgi:hypothetical protein